MKKFFYLLLASVFAFAFTSCSDDEDDVPSSTVAALAGSYESVMDYSLVEMPGEPSKNHVTVNIQSAGGNKVNIQLPAFGAGMMSIPAVVINEVEVAKENGVYTFSKKVDGTVEVNGAQKTYTVDLTGKISADRQTFELVEKMKYGNMPFTLLMQYQPYSVAGMVAGNYAADMNVSLLEMPDNGVLISTQPTLKVEAIGADQVKVTLPEIVYEEMKMTIPGIVIDNAKVAEDGDNYKVTADYKGKADEKDVECKLEGSKNADGSFKYTATIKYGKMPMHLVAAFTPQTEKK